MLIAPGRCEWAYTIGASASTSTNSLSASIFRRRSLAVIGRSSTDVNHAVRSHSLRKPDHMTLRIGEERDRHLWQLRDREDGLAAELFHLVERRLRVVRRHVERDVSVAVRRLADAAGDAALLLLDHRVRHLARNLLGLPAEDLAVELLQLPEVAARHLEMHDRMCHFSSSHIAGDCVTHASSPGSRPAAASSSRGTE